LRKEPCLSIASVAGVRQLGSCARVRLPPPGRWRTGLFHGVPRKTHGGVALGRLLFVTAEPHSLGGGGGQHRGRRTGTWPRGLLLAEPPPRVAGHTCDGDEAATKTRKTKAGEGDRRWKVGQSIYLKGSDAQMIQWLTNTRRQWRGGARSVRMKNSSLFPFSSAIKFCITFLSVNRNPNLMIFVFEFF
jgi:hypothetical protein